MIFLINISWLIRINLKDYDDIPTKEVKLPYSTICGNLNWKMTYNNIIIHIKIFYKLKENNQIINYSEFKSRFTYR